jgi:hypothetical protein
MRLTLLWALVPGVAFLGCAGEDPFEQARRDAGSEALGVGGDLDSLSSPETDADVSEAPPTEASQPDVSEPPSPDISPPAPGPRAPPPQQESPPPMPYQPPASQDSVIREKADVGAGKKGDYGPGFITTPLSVFWRTQEMAAYRIKVPHALNLYKGMHGHFPKTQEEFVREILEANAIKLPELPEGHYYVYDSEKGELQVARPR